MLEVEGDQPLQEDHNENLSYVPMQNFVNITPKCILLQSKLA